jgi:hypothetical protein
VAAALVLLSSGQLAAMEGNFWMTHNSKYSLPCVYPMMHTPGKTKACKHAACRNSAAAALQQPACQRHSVAVSSTGNQQALRR